MKWLSWQSFVGIVVGLIVPVATPTPGSATGLRSRAEVDLESLIPLVAWNRPFKITAGKDRGKLVPLELERDPATDGRWTLRFGDYARLVMKNEAGRGLVMERVDLINSRSYIAYGPGLPVLGDIVQESTVARQADFKLFDRSSGKLKRAGRVIHRIKRVSPSRFETPAGLIDGYYVEIDHRMEMPYAELQITIGLGCRLDDGPVFGFGEYRVTKLGIFTETKTAAAALARTRDEFSLN